MPTRARVGSFRCAREGARGARGERGEQKMEGGCILHAHSVRVGLWALTARVQRPRAESGLDRAHGRLTGSRRWFIMTHVSCTRASNGEATAGGSMRNAVVVTTDKFTARYYGGVYIDLYDNQTGECYDCINVWDYEERVASIAHSVDGVRDAIRDLQDDDARLHPEMYR